MGLVASDTPSDSVRRITVFNQLVIQCVRKSEENLLTFIESLKASAQKYVSLVNDDVKGAETPKISKLMFFYANIPTQEFSTLVSSVVSSTLNVK